jgi:hypothetical protein
VQCLYTAAPIFEPGRADPLPSRKPCILPGTAAVHVPEIPEPAPPPEARPVIFCDGTAPYGRAALEAAVACIAAAPEGSRHATAVKEACAMAALQRAGALGPEWGPAIYDATFAIRRDAREAAGVVAFGNANPSERRATPGEAWSAAQRAFRRYVARHYGRMDDLEERAADLCIELGLDIDLANAAAMETIAWLERGATQ